MIKTVGQLLEAFIAKESQALEAEKVKHRPTLGAMYEDLTADVLRLSLITERPLKVVSGFIVKPDGSDSEEMDCMLITGDPIPIGRSDKVRCHVEDVIAVVQSKKTLNQAMLLDGIDNLAGVRKLSPGRGTLSRLRVKQNFQLITRTALPDDVKTLPLPLEVVYYQLAAAAALPACIILSYGGYRTHDGFRDGLMESLSERLGQGGYGPMGLPDVILNQRFAAVKLVGLPWWAPMQDDWWPLLATAEMRPTAAFLLEAIYTKLVLRDLADDSVFGEDLENDPLTLLARYRLDPSGKGWHGETFQKKGLATGHDKPQEWSPVFLSDAQATFVTRLCNEEEIEIGTPADEGMTDADLRFLVDAGLIGHSPGKPRHFRLMTVACQICVLPDGRIAAAENNSGRLTRWVLKFMAAWKAKAAESDANTGNS